MLRRRTLLNSPCAWLCVMPMSSSADPDHVVPTKLFGLFNSAECEGRNCEPAAGDVGEGTAASVRRADRLYLSGATRVAAA